MRIPDAKRRLTKEGPSCLLPSEPHSEAAAAGGSVRGGRLADQFSGVVGATRVLTLDDPYRDGEEIVGIPNPRRTGAPHLAGLRSAGGNRLPAPSRARRAAIAASPESRCIKR